MLDPNEKLVFDSMVTSLGEADPEFLRRVHRLTRPRRKLRMALAILLWTLAPVCIVVGGWTGLIMAVVAAGYGAYLTGRTGGGHPQSSGRPAFGDGRPEVLG